MKADTRATLELLVHELLEDLNDLGYPDDRSRILAAKRTMRSWVEANHLRPEQVETLSAEEFDERFRRKWRLRR
jgi:hypothetical protein